MSITTIHAALCDTLDSGSLGFVDRNRGRKQQLPWQSETLAPLWVPNFLRSRPIKRTNLSQTYERVYEINGFFPFNYEAKSDEKWLVYLSALELLLSPQPAIVLCTQTFPPNMMENNHVVYCEVECHHVRAEFTVWEVLDG